MASNYTGNPVAVEAPASAPGPSVAPIYSLPADTDGASWANVYQALKTSADYAAYVNTKISGAVSDFQLQDDFTGAALSTYLWDPASATGASVVDDSANGGFGAVQWSHAPTLTESFITKQKLVIGSGDFQLVARPRITSMATGASFATWGLVAGTNFVQFTAFASGANWKAEINGVGSTDTGVAWGSTYQKMEIRRIGGTFTFLINGVSVYTNSSVVAIPDAQLGFKCNAVVSGTLTILFDYLKGWVAR